MTERMARGIITMPPAERSLASVSGVAPAPWAESIGSPAVAFVSAAFNVEDAA
jgi:hypothetical protein